MRYEQFPNGHARYVSSAVARDGSRATRTWST